MAICEFCKDQFEPPKPWLKRRFCGKSCASKNTVSNRTDIWRPDNKGRDNPMYGKPQTNTNSLSNLRHNYWIGKHHSVKSNQKRSITMIGIKRSEETKEKTRRTNIERGNWLSPDDPKYIEFKKYKRKVYYWTHKNNLSMLEFHERRGRDFETDFHLDHKFSIFEGFQESMSPKLIGCIHNLHFIPATENIKKGTDCWITKERLYELFESCS